MCHNCSWQFFYTIYSIQSNEINVIDFATEKNLTNISSAWLFLFHSYQRTAFDLRVHLKVTVRNANILWKRAGQKQCTRFCSGRVIVQRIFETLPAVRPSPDELFLCINSRVTIRRGEFHGNSNGQCSMKNAEPARDIVRRNNSIRDLAWDRLTRDVGRERGDRMRKIKKKMERARETDRMTGRRK